MNGIVVEDLSDGQEPTSAVPAQPTSSIEHLAIASRFNADPDNKEDNKKLAEIWQFAKSKSNSQEINDLIWEVMHLESILGATRIGESRLDRVYRYCKLRRQESIIQQELKNVAVGGNI
jgi:hypothetical protein